MAATLVPHIVVVPVRLSGGRPDSRVFVRRRMLVSLVLVAVIAALWLGAGSVLANRGGDPASAPAVRPAAPAAAAAQVYVAQEGDTLWSIAARFHGRIAQGRYVDMLVDANHGATLQIGQSVILP